MKLVVGLGNPGDEYKNVRHNLGFMVLDEMFPEAKWVQEKKFNSLLLKTADTIFIKPQTFMNNSGQAVSAVSKYFKIDPKDIILVYDELDLPLGKIRVKMGGGAAGHHGVESVIEALKTDQFQRVRLGIGPSTGAPEKFVLDWFDPSEKREVQNILKEAVSAIEKIIRPPVNNKQTILAVDDNGKFLEYIPKEEGHTGKGRKHLAMTVILENSRREVLLQKRKHRIFDNIWDITGATHPLHLESRDESLEEASMRCLSEEWGIKEKVAFKNLGFFNYFAPYGDLCENEHCAVMYGLYDGELKLNKEMGYEYKWVNKQEFLKDIANYPQKYTKWAQGTVRILSEACGLSA